MPDFQYASAAEQLKLEARSFQESLRRALATPALADDASLTPTKGNARRRPKE